LRFWPATHVSRVNYTKMAGDKPRQPAALNVDFINLGPDPLGLRRSAHTGVKESYHSKKCVIYPLFACLA